MSNINRRKVGWYWSLAQIFIL